MPENNKKVAGGLTQAQIDKLKNQHGKLRLVTVNHDSGEQEHFWFKKPNMATMSAYMKYANHDPMRAGQIAFNDCLVMGRKEAVDDVETFMSVLPAISDIVKKLETEVKEF